MVGLFRMNLILDNMQKVMFTSPKEKVKQPMEVPSDLLAKYQAFYH